MAKKKADVDRLVERLIDSTSRVPDTNELASEIVESFGGASSLAKEIYKTYEAAKGAPMIRGRILNDVMLLIRHASEKSAANRGTDLKSLDKDDLTALVLKVLERKGANQEEVKPEGETPPQG